jgi:hypothetical protein
MISGVNFCAFLLRKVWSLLQLNMLLKQLCQSVCVTWLWIYGLRQKLGPLIVVVLAACHTPTSSRNGILWVYLENLLFWQFTYLPRGKQVLPLNRMNVACVSLACTRMKVAVCKILSCFMICFIEFVNHSSLTWMWILMIYAWQHLPVIHVSASQWLDWILILLINNKV